MIRRPTPHGTTATLSLEPLDRAALRDRPSSLVGLAGAVFGKRFVLSDNSTLLGRDPEECQVVIDDAGVSRVHAEIERVAGSYVLRDRGSKNGVLVDGVRTDQTPLADGQHIAIGKSILKFLSANPVEEDYHDRLVELSATDSLTGLANRRSAWETLTREVARVARGDTRLAIAMFDVDHFKQVNDAYGHAVGDACLVELATRARGASRAQDIIARIGGEEFVAILVDTDGLEAVDAATRILHAVAAQPFATAAGPLRVTVSVGVADVEELVHTQRVELDRHLDAVEALVALADAKLYEAKQLGRNRVSA
ncbi:MAG: GGDEF domain-containing protein [Myxococcales bacterium]|nr:GGDEF domain-containing protein [Myxococcales bacterium]MCB9533255.1 GGDEF domain-containing protein [Myxococcales bacterium]